MSSLTQDQIKVRMRRLDDVFHRMIIALERLEIFTEGVRLNGQANVSLIKTAIGTDRDLHDDGSNPPTRDSFYGEVQLDLSALFFQTQFDDKEVFDSSVKYFLGNLLEWYGGRDESIPYNGVDAYFLPIISSLSQQVESVAEVMDVVEKYVAIIPGMSSFSDDEKAEAIAQSIEKLILVMDEKHEQEHHQIEDVEATFTAHKRGDMLSGYKRLINAMLNMFDEAMPALVVYRTVSNYLPDIAESVPTINEDTINEFISSKETTNNINSSNDSLLENSESSNSEEKSDENAEKKEKSRTNESSGIIEKIINILK